MNLYRITRRIRKRGEKNFHQLIIIKEKYEENYDLYTLYDKFIYNK